MAADINGGPANGAVVKGWSPGVGEPAPVSHVDMHGGEPVFIEEVGRGPVRVAPGRPPDIKDTPGHDGVKGQAAAQVIGRIRATVLDPGMPPEGLEAFLNRPHRWSLPHW